MVVWGGTSGGAALVCFSLSEITSFMGIRDYSALQRAAARVTAGKQLGITVAVLHNFHYFFL